MYMRELQNGLNDEEEVEQFTGDLDSDDEEDESFKWWQYDDAQNYFVLATKYKADYKPGEQVYNCYGRRSNRFLFTNYGFVLRHNKYNSLSFRIWIDAGRQKELDAKFAAGDTSEVQKDSRTIRLKLFKLNLDLLAYMRKTLLVKYKGDNMTKLLVSKPVDFQFELIVVQCTINLLKGLLN